MKGNGTTRRALLGNIAMLGVAAGSGKAFAKTHRFSPVQQPFSDPYLELVRLLKEGAEIEQDLMLQYLYAAFSLKPAYKDLVGASVPKGNTLMGIIIQEMQHLRDVNRLLVELDAAPVLTRLDIPYETDVYPFPYELAPLGSVSLAKFTYCEADPVRLGHVWSLATPNVKLTEKLKASFGGTIPVNHVGKLYDAITETLGDLKQAAGAPKIDYGAWFQNIGQVKAEGEFDHFKFFHQLYEGAHPLIKDTPDIWTVPATDPRYPCYQVPVNPTAYEGRPNTIKNESLRQLAWLGNMNYWTLLLLLDRGYRKKSKQDMAFAQALMMDPIMKIGQYLPTKGSALPFDPLSMGFNPGLTEASARQLIRRFLEETRTVARSLEEKKLLPSDFNIKIYDQLLAAAV